MNNNVESPWLGESEIKEIKQSVSIDSVLEHFGMSRGLTQKGTRLVGRSPFREDKNPSFSADLSKNLWNDFGGRPVVDGTEVSGDIFGLVQAIQQCSFREAALELHSWISSSTVENLAKSKRQQVSNTIANDRPRSQVRQKEESANIPFGRELRGRTRIQPLMDRGIKEKTIKKFGVVYCTAGLMKGRIAFPIKNADGQIMAYAGRAVKKSDEEKNGKYKLPPNFCKLQELFNIDRIVGNAETKKAVKNFGIIIVEGFTDAMKLDQEGFSNVVALMGTTMSETQKKMLLDPQINPTRRLTLFLDNDDTGQQAKRKMAGELIYDGFVRYVDWKQASEDKIEPEHFDKEELVNLIGYK